MTKIRTFIVFVLVGVTFASACFASTTITKDSLRRIQRATAESNPGDPQINSLDYLLRLFSIYLSPGRKFVDLGSGDGRVVLLASMYGTDSTGIEIDPVRFQASLDATKSLDALVDSKRIHFFNNDIFKSDFSPFDVFFIDQGWPDSDNKILEAKLSMETKPGSIFILHDPAPLRINQAVLIEDFKILDDGSEVSVQIYKKISGSIDAHEKV